MSVGSVLVLNAGSSTLKVSVLAGDGNTLAALTVPMRGRETVPAAVASALDGVRGHTDDLRAVGHRVVHGGPLFTRTTRIDDDVLATIHKLAWLAPLHNPVAADVIAAAREALPRVPHAAAFDTAYHSTLPEAAFIYALPYEWYADWGYRRYGFHGLSVAWSVERASALLGASDLGIVVAHLGAGCSVTAAWQGRSMSTSMGMTPLEGLVMGTRAGSVDPGILLAAQRDHGLDPRALEDVLEHRSGLLGLSGRTAEMRELVGLAATDARAALAVSVFERAAAGAIASATTTLPRLDAIIFTGGIGERASTIRAGIVRRLAAIGVRAVPERDVVGDTVLITSPVAVVVVAAREDVVIAREVLALLA